MTELFSTTGFVLRRRVHKEADRVYTFFSRDLGKIDLLSRGGSRPHAKLASPLESFSLVRAFLVNGKGGYTLAGSDIDECFVPTPGDSIQTSLFLAGRHLVDLATRHHQEDAWLYRRLAEWMRLCHEGRGVHPSRAKLLTSAFALRVLRHAGYAPELFFCLDCRKDVAASSFGWSGARGGVVCSNCFNKHDREWIKVRPIHRDTLKLLRFSDGSPWEHMMKVELHPERTEEFHALVDSLILAHFPVIPTVPLPDLTFVGQVPSFSIE